MVEEELLPAFRTRPVLPVVARPGLATEATPAGPRRALSANLAAPALCVALSCTFDGVFERRRVSGLQWDVSESE